jgi:hypothetical protein
MNMHGLGVGHRKYPTCGLKGGFLGKLTLGELPLGESLSCPRFGGW